MPAAADSLDLSQERVCVTGGAGFLGRSVCAVLRSRGVSDAHVIVPRRHEYDLTIESAVERLFNDARPTVVIHLAAEVGGIGANRAAPGKFFHANMAMGLHLIEHARRRAIRKFIMVGTVCAYPKFAPVPFRESALWDGYPEETNAPYGVAKRSLFVMLDAYHRQYALPCAVLVPANLYGPGDNFNPATSHVIPALIKRIEEARAQGSDTVTCWGTGSATREFLYVDECADAVVRAAERINEPLPINLGTGIEITIRDLVTQIASLCGFMGRVAWDPAQPDGQPRRCLDVSAARRLLDWSAHVPLHEGLKRTIEWYRGHAQTATDPRA